MVCMCFRPLLELSGAFNHSNDELHPNILQPANSIYIFIAFCYEEGIYIFTAFWYKDSSRMRQKIVLFNVSVSFPL